MPDARTILRLAILFCAATATLPGQAQLPNRAEPLPGITTSGQPDQRALEALADDGFKVVIDLRAAEENRGLDERKAVEALGMTYITLPIAGADGITYENAAALDAILRATAGPVLLHCATGNRAGALLSLRQHLNGASTKDALALGIEAGMTNPVLRRTVEARFGER